MNFRLKRFKKIKPIHLAALLALGMIILAFGNFSLSKENNSAPEKSENTEALPNDGGEERLAEIIEKIKGVSDVSVYITYENGGVKKLDYNVKENTDSSGGSESQSRESTAVTKRQSSDEEPFVREETKPQVRGVLIVAKGADDPLLNARITEAVSAVLGVAVHKVKILPSD